MKNYCVLIIIFAFVSCNKNKINQIDINENIKIEDLIEITSLSSIVDSSYYVSLESNEKCLIGNVDKIVFFDDKIFILDSEQAIGVYVFDLDGKFINKIDKIGKGPGEFMPPLDFAIDKFNKQILIIDDNSKLITYDFNANFLREVKISFPVCKIEQINSDNFAFIGSGQEDNLILTDKNFKRKKSYYKYNPINAILGSKQFIKNNNTLIYQQTGNDTLFSVLSDTIIPIRRFYVNDSEKLKKLPMLNISILKQVSSYAENKNFIYFRYHYKSNPYAFIYSKKTKKFKLISKNLEDDIIGYPYLPNIQTTYNNYFVSVIQPFNLLDKSKIYKNRIKVSITNSSNPIIGFYKFKNINNIK